MILFIINLSILKFAGKSNAFHLSPLAKNGTQLVDFNHLSHFVPVQAAAVCFSIHFHPESQKKSFTLRLKSKITSTAQQMAQQEDLFKKLISHCKEYGFVFPSSEIYDGLGAVYDYGQNGVELKNNIKKYWWDSMTLLNDNIVGIDSAIFMHPTIWKASGHVDAFNDPLIDNRDSKKRYRADVLIEEQLAKYDDRIAKETEKATARFGEAFNKEQFLSTSPRVQEILAKRDALHARFARALNDNNLEELRQIILDCEIVCPISGTRNWTEVRQFNLMFATEMGSTADGATKIYLRPETAQGIFVNFLNVQKTGRMKIPFGIAQIGKAFRNEIVARQFIFRMREFEQMEMQFFVRPGEELTWFARWKEIRMKWHKALGLGDNRYRYHDHDKLAHYANAATDIEFEMPFGFKEVEGIHSRTDFDLSSHEKYSGKKIQYFDTEQNRSYVPYVIETSIGVDRMFLSILSGAYSEEPLSDGETRVVLKLPPALAPVKLAVLPLVKKDGLPEKAREIVDLLKFDFNCRYDEKDSIGKRYRRQDAIGTPFCITIDHDTPASNTVTIRYRDTMQQERVDIDRLPDIISEKVSMKNLFKQQI
jgi:glycyl-tRNA synthetase